jgi:WD40 repeat protein/serine/threonine protein kinase
MGYSSFVCTRGHQWQPDADHTLSSDASPHCPVCGGDAVAPKEILTLSPDLDGDATLPRSETVPDSVTFRPALPGFEVERELGRGGMGVVYLARQTKLNRLVALKMILSGSHAGPQERERFRIEAQAAAQLHHPNIVQIYEVGEADGHPYLALEYVPGKSLADQLTGTPWPARDSARLVEPLARAIHHAHERGVIHRDLKPANVLLSAELGTRSAESRTRDAKSNPSTFRIPRSEFRAPKITDFGLAKQVSESGERTEGAGPTRTGAVMGTPSYIAPEQASGRAGAVGPGADVYALGAILYELLTGRPPFRGETPMDTVMQVMRDEPVPPHRLQPKVPRDLETICMKCLQKDPKKRYATAAALADDLQRYANNEPILARPVSALQRLMKWARRRPTAAALVLVGILAAVSVLATSIVVNVKLNAAAERERIQSYQANIQKEAAEKESRRAEGEKKKADERRVEAETAKREAEKQATEARRSMYALQLAQVNALGERNPSRALQLLADPRRCPIDLRDFTWGYLRNICRTERPPLRGHEATVSGVAFSLDGQTLASVSWDHLLCIWNPAGGPPRLKIKAHNGRILAVAFSPDGKTLATAGDDKIIKLWSVEIAPTAVGIVGGFAWPVPLVRERAVLAGHTDSVRCLAFSPDGKTLATAGEDGTIKIWNVDSHKTSTTLRGHRGAVRSLAFSLDGQTLASGGGDTTIKLWNVSEKNPIASLAGHSDIVVALAFSPDGKTLASGSEVNDQSVRLWDVAKREERAQLKGHLRAVYAVAFSPDGQTLATGSVDRTIRLWDPTSARERTVLHGHFGQIFGIAFSPDSRVLASGAADRLVRMWDLDEHREETRTIEHVGRLGPLRVSRDAHFLIYNDGIALHQWNLLTDSVTVLPGGVAQIAQVATGENGVVAALDAANTVRIWREGQLVRAMTNIAEARAIAVSRDGRFLAVGDSKGTIQLIEIATGKKLASRTDHTRAIEVLVFSPDGTILASGGADHAIHVYDAATLTHQSELAGHTIELKALAISCDSKTLASGDAAGGMRLWNLTTGEGVPLTGHAARVSALSFTPDGRTLASGSLDRTITLWDGVTGQERTTLTGHTHNVAHVAFSSDGGTLVSVTEDGTVKIWRAERR